jgi:hypothetical protein
MPRSWLRPVPDGIPRQRGRYGHPGCVCPACGASGGLGGVRRGISSMHRATRRNPGAVKGKGSPVVPPLGPQARLLLTCPQGRCPGRRAGKANFGAHSGHTRCHGAVRAVRGDYAGVPESAVLCCLCQSEWVEAFRASEFPTGVSELPTAASPSLSVLGDPCG